MQISTIEVRRPDGKLVKINKSDRLGFAKIGCDIDPHKERKTSGGETPDQQTPEAVEACDEVEALAEVEAEKVELLKPKTVKLEKSVKVESPILVEENLSDLIVN